MPRDPSARRAYIESLKAQPGADPAQIERDEAIRQGYTRGVEPTPLVRQIGPPGLVQAESDAEKERRRRAKVAAGIPLGQEEVQ